MPHPIWKPSMSNAHNATYTTAMDCRPWTLQPAIDLRSVVQVCQPEDHQRVHPLVLLHSSRASWQQIPSIT